ADVVGTNSTAALAFGDADAASDTLEALSVNPSIVGAVIVLPNDEVFALYAREGVSTEAVLGEIARDSGGAREPAWHRFTWRELTVSRPIVLGGNQMGTVKIHAHLTDLFHRGLAFSSALIVVLGASLAVAMTVSLRMQRRITGP